MRCMHFYYGKRIWKRWLEKNHCFRVLASSIIHFDLVSLICVEQHIWILFVKNIVTSNEGFKLFN